MSGVRQVTAGSVVFGDPKAMVLIGNNYGAIAYYPQAATKFEEYSKKYGGEKDSASALANAVFYRKGIGQDAKAIKDIEFFVKQYGKKKKHKKEAAAALFGMTGIYEKQGNKDKVLKHLKRYLKVMGKKGGIDWQIAAHVKIGEILWARSRALVRDEIVQRDDGDKQVSERDCHSPANDGFGLDAIRAA